jgi:hypothetical protein
MAMNFQRYTSGARVNVGDVRGKYNGAWRDVDAVYASEDGVWVKVWERTPPFQNINALDSLGFKQTGGGGWINSYGGGNLSLAITDNGPSEATIQFTSDPFIAPSETVISCNYYMEGNRADTPNFYMYSTNGEYIFDAYYSNEVVYLSATFGRGVVYTLRMGYTLLDTSTVDNDVSYIFLRDLKINGKPMAWT